MERLTFGHNLGGVQKLNVNNKKAETITEQPNPNTNQMSRLGPTFVYSTGQELRRNL